MGFSISPSGALTSKPFAFVARPWELVAVPSADVFDSFMGSVRLDLRGTEILRVLPLINESLNEEWLTDKVRFSYDGLKRQRVLHTYAFDSLLSIEFRFASVINLDFQRRLKKLDTRSKVSFLKQLNAGPLSETSLNSVSVTVGKETDLESLILWDSMLRTLFRSVYYNLSDFYSTNISPSLYRIDQERLLSSQTLVLSGTNLRWESPLLNIKVLRRVRDAGLTAYTCGVRSVFNFDTTNLGANIGKFLSELLVGRSKFLRNRIRFNEKLYMLFHPLYAPSVEQLSCLTAKVGSISPKLSIFTSWSASQGYAELLGETFLCVPPKTNLALFLNTDNAPSSIQTNLSIGYFTHGSAAHRKFDLLFPVPAYSEISCHYLNVFGYERYARFGTQILGDSLPSWYSFFKEFFSIRSKFFSRLAYSLCTFFSCSNSMSTPFEEDHFKISFFKPFVPSVIKLFCRSNIIEVVPNYYRTHYIARASKPMALASARFNLAKLNF